MEEFIESSSGFFLIWYSENLRLILVEEKNNYILFRGQNWAKLSEGADIYMAKK